MSAEDSAGIDSRVQPLGLPFPPMVLEVPNQLLLLTIHGNHQLASRFKGLPRAIDLLKLSNPIFRVVTFSMPVRLHN
jgi:hypothetical protein